MPKALITIGDVLAPSGHPVRLEVELERRWMPFIDPPMAGEEIELEGVGKSVTDLGGRASFSIEPPKPGAHHYRARWRDEAAEAMVLVKPAETPLFITDIDGTIADVSSFGFIVRSNGSVRPMADAPEILQEISRTMTVLYLSARDHVFGEKTKAWLRMHGFPEGPLYVRRVRFWSATPMEHKLARLGEIRPRFTNVRWGVGDLPGDVEAYAAHGIKPILISRRPPRLPEGAVGVASWREIREAVR